MNSAVRWRRPRCIEEVDIAHSHSRFLERFFSGGRGAVNMSSGEAPALAMTRILARVSFHSPSRIPVMRGPAAALSTTPKNYPRGEYG